MPICAGPPFARSSTRLCASTPLHTVSRIALDGANGGAHLGRGAYGNPHSTGNGSRSAVLSGGVSQDRQPRTRCRAAGQLPAGGAAGERARGAFGAGAAGAGRSATAQDGAGEL